MKVWKGGLLMGGVMLLTSTWAWSEGWEEEHAEHASKMSQSQVTNHATGAIKGYKNECAACHMLYPANLLPARSWQRVMSNLDHHFGENAELDQKDRTSITKYLMGHAADQSRNYFGRRINQSIPKDSVPLRISETRYFLQKHHEIPSRLVSKNPKVGSFSNCIACHSGAERGSFDEDEVVIPGAGRWED
ncbi:MAG: diheme cytochrome c [Zetaproteobacteria bacterium]|nr:diheme cytochrome c [Zetaproteobacteria bacterium]